MQRDDKIEERLTVVELLIDTASAARDVLAEENGVDVVGGTVRVGRVDIFECYQHTAHEDTKGVLILPFSSEVTQ